MKRFGVVKHKRTRIMDMPPTLRPREKLFATGAKSLSEKELLAILLGTGTRKQNALILGDKLLKKFPLKKLDGKVGELVRYPGVGSAKAARIAAALELGERLFAPASVTKVTIRTAEDVLLQTLDIASKRQEYLVALYLDARHELLAKEVVGMGNLNSLRITPKEIFGLALQTPCASVIVVHNHPSGDTSPSDDDIHFTRRIYDAGEVMGIPMIDHVIVGKSGYYSFREDKKRV
jgi:DNA repair protein RadC